MERIGLPQFVGVVCLFVVAGCSSLTVNTDHDPNIDFSQYKTFAFISKHPLVVSGGSGPQNPLTEGRIMNSVRNAMQAKGFGYREGPESADIAIAFSVGSREKIRVDSYPATYRSGWGGAGWGGPYYGGVYATETRVSQYTQGQLAIDIFDVKTHAPAFHGTATKTITSSDEKNAAQLLDDVVNKILENFPPS